MANKQMHHLKVGDNIFEIVDSVARSGISGAPSIVSLSSAMIDTDKLYLYIGSEAGYTSGDWYYYNGTSWVSGGQYGDMQLDTSLTTSGMAADAKSVGDRFNSFATTATAGQAPIADGQGGWQWGDVESSGSGLTTAQKSTLMAVINAIGAFNVPNGQELIDAFNSAWETTVESISVNPTTLTFNGVEVKTITATTVPSGEPVIWTSSDASVAEVENGQVASVGNGTCTITASSGDKSATCAVTVTGIAQRFTVTNNLTNVSNSNDDRLVAEGGTYEGTLTADSGYEIGTVTVTMGGNDVTSTVYSDGSISISNVTGAIVITASAVVRPDYTKGTLKYSWDFTQGLTDSVASATATLNGNATRDNSGLHLADNSSYLKLPNNCFSAGDIIELDIANTQAGFGNVVARLLMWASNKGLIYRYNTTWNVFTTDWSDNAAFSENLSSKDVFSGHMCTVELSNYVNVYLDGHLMGTSTVTRGTITTNDDKSIGSSTTGFYTATITGMRIYSAGA